MSQDFEFDSDVSYNRAFRDNDEIETDVENNIHIAIGKARETHTPYSRQRVSKPRVERETPQPQPQPALKVRMPVIKFKAKKLEVLDHRRLPGGDS